MSASGKNSNRDLEGWILIHHQYQLKSLQSVIHSALIFFSGKTGQYHHYEYVTGLLWKLLEAEHETPMKLHHDTFSLKKQLINIHQKRKNQMVRVQIIWKTGSYLSEISSS